jgi:diamine N-acetyltransferase
VIELREITDQNRAEIYALRVAPGQERFVSGVEDSIQEAVEEPDGRALYWAVYDAETPVGFVMITDETSGAPGYIAQYLWKLLIDERHQRKGHGTAVLDLVADFFRRRPEVDVMWTSAGQGDASPIPFYERYGFERTDEIVFDDEVLFRYPLR